MDNTEHLIQDIKSSGLACYDSGEENYEVGELSRGDVIAAEECHANLKVELAKLREENQKLRDMLKRLEWCYESESYSDLCPVCFELKHKGHAPNCELAQLLEETK